MFIIQKQFGDDLTVFGSKNQITIKRVTFDGSSLFLWIMLQQTPVITNEKAEIKCESYVWLSGSVRERQGASKRVRFLIFPSPQKFFDELKLPFFYVSNLSNFRPNFRCPKNERF